MSAGPLVVTYPPEIGEEGAAVLSVPLADPPRDDGLASTGERQESILIAEVRDRSVSNAAVSSRRSSMPRLARFG
jgi:hypothetical protein